MKLVYDRKTLRLKDWAVPLALPDEKHFEAARGYVELGMFLEANEELEKIDSFNRTAPEVLALRVDIYRGLQKWELMRELTERLYDEDLRPLWDSL